MEIGVAFFRKKYVNGCSAFPSQLGEVEAVGVQGEDHVTHKIHD
jgi:hypothetical protein